MKCPKCESTEISKNGLRHGQQNYIYKSCSSQFVESYDAKGYPDQIKQQCLEMYVNGMGFRGIERVTGVHHTTVIHWVKQAGIALPHAPEVSEIPEVGELDELETFVGAKKNKIWLWTAVNHFSRGILAWVLGDRSAETFEPLWQIVRCWQSYFYVTDGYKVYQCFIDEGNQIVSKTYMTRVENENTMVQTLFSSIDRKTLCYSKSEEMLRYSIRLLLHYLNNRSVPLPA